ncbi:hypothetical protein [Sphingomonas sp. Ant H11]|uniref:hypothetical protein n=1 Tax=Sphingomonas sp. Ant H11 TaxID=1564113 RepID=UPI000AC28933|nr:hypothetical protein [Sphingomonas sp. Ant H11]
MNGTLKDLLADRPRTERQAVRRAVLCAALVAVASVALLALSGWFLTAAALAAGAGTALAFNYMLPSAAIRLFAIVRTGARYGERLASHDAALSAIARVRPALFAALAATPVARALSLSTGEASTRLVQDASAIETALVLRSGTVGGAVAILSGGALIALAGPLPVVAVALVAVLLYAAIWTVSRELEASGSALLREAERLRPRPPLWSRARPSCAVMRWKIGPWRASSTAAPHSPPPNGATAMCVRGSRWRRRLRSGVGRRWRWSWRHPKGRRSLPWPRWRRRWRLTAWHPRSGK